MITVLNCCHFPSESPQIQSDKSFWCLFFFQCLCLAEPEMRQGSSAGNVRTQTPLREKGQRSQSLWFHSRLQTDQRSFVLGVNSVDVLLCLWFCPTSERPESRGAAAAAAGGEDLQGVHGQAGVHRLHPLWSPGGVWRLRRQPASLPHLQGCDQRQRPCFHVLRLQWEAAGNTGKLHEWPWVFPPSVLIFPCTDNRLKITAGCVFCLSLTDNFL